MCVSCGCGLGWATLAPEFLIRMISYRNYGSSSGPRSSTSYIFASCFVQSVDGWSRTCVALSTPPTRWSVMVVVGRSTGGLRCWFERGEQSAWLAVACYCTCLYQGVLAGEALPTRGLPSFPASLPAVDEFAASGFGGSGNIIYLPRFLILVDSKAKVTIVAQGPAGPPIHLQVGRHATVGRGNGCCARAKTCGILDDRVAAEVRGVGSSSGSQLKFGAKAPPVMATVLSVFYGASGFAWTQTFLSRVDWASASIRRMMALDGYFILTVDVDLFGGVNRHGLEAVAKLLHLQA